MAIPFLATLDVLYDDDAILAFHHTRPFWETHRGGAQAARCLLNHAGEEDAELLRRLFVVVQDVARDVEGRTGAASVVTNLGRYQDSKHLHIHVHSGGRLKG